MADIFASLSSALAGAATGGDAGSSPASPPPPPAPGVEGATWLAGQQLNAAMAAQDAKRAAAIAKAPNQFSVARRWAEAIPSGAEMAQRSPDSRGNAATGF